MLAAKLAALWRPVWNAMSPDVCLRRLVTDSHSCTAATCPHCFKHCQATCIALMSVRLQGPGCAPLHSSQVSAQSQSKKKAAVWVAAGACPCPLLCLHGLWEGENAMPGYRETMMPCTRRRDRDVSDWLGSCRPQRLTPSPPQRRPSCLFWQAGGLCGSGWQAQESVRKLDGWQQQQQQRR